MTVNRYNPALPHASQFASTRAIPPSVRIADRLEDFERIQQDDKDRDASNQRMVEEQKKWDEQRTREFKEDLTRIKNGTRDMGNPADALQDYYAPPLYQFGTPAPNR